MEEVVQTYQELKDIEIEGDFIGNIMYKPTWPIYIMMIFAFALLFVNSWAARALAIFIGAITAFVFFKIDDKKTLSVYTKCILIYDYDGEKAFKIDNSDIAKYDTGITEQYKILIELVNGRQLFKETYRMSDAVKYLKVALPKKSTQEVNREKNKNTKFDPIGGFKQLFGVKDKKKKEDENSGH